MEYGNGSIYTEVHGRYLEVLSVLKFLSKFFLVPVRFKQAGGNLKSMQARS